MPNLILLSRIGNIGFMKTAALPNINQKMIMRELSQLKSKMRILGSLRRFEELAKKARNFTKAKGIKIRDVLEND